MTKLTFHLQRFARDRRGNVLILIGFLLVPVIGCIGFAADYGIALTNKARCDAAADAAVIVAINTAQTVLSGGGSATTAVSQGKTAAAAAFKANAGALGFANVPTPNVQIPTPTGLTVTATVSYSMSVATQFSKVLGVPSITVGNTSAASLSRPTYQNYYVITDISNSMGIGSTPTDMANLFNRAVAINPGNYQNNPAPYNLPAYQANALVNGGCVFACHNASPGDAYSMEYVAHDTSFGTPITLRLDAAMTAIQDMITNAKTSQTNSTSNGYPSNLIQIGLYTMGGFANQAPPGPDTQPIPSNQPNAPSGAANMLYTVSNLTSNFSNLASLTATPASSPLSSNTPVVHIDSNAGNVGWGDSLSSTALTQFYNTVLSSTTNGTGATSSTPQNFVFIVTDGVEDYTSSGCTWTHCTGTIDPTVCAQLKTKATVGVIYTTYNTIYTNNVSTQGLDNRYVALVQPIAAQIAPALQACATSSLFYFEATDGPAILTGMRQLMANSQLKARLTQ
jgi:Flp pilus assembly protein TadG